MGSLRNHQDLQSQSETLHALSLRLLERFIESNSLKTTLQRTHAGCALPERPDLRTSSAGFRRQWCSDTQKRIYMKRELPLLLDGGRMDQDLRRVYGAPDATAPSLVAFRVGVNNTGPIARSSSSASTPWKPHTYAPRRISVGYHAGGASCACGMRPYQSDVRRVVQNRIPATPTSLA
jgi:hypothetical protein